jgi:glycosyltransferase involved in cell wall biosynthesis
MEIVIVIPTRNRARIAKNAIRSVLDERLDGVRVMVSDNSTAEPDREELAAFCEALDDSRVRYVRPPESLSMPAHWEWAIEEALAFYENASHFTYVTDRMMFKTGGLEEVLDVAVRYPDKIVSYNQDRIVDHVRPIHVDHYPSTAKLWEVPTERLSWLVSQAAFHHGLPRMLNCIVPRAVFDRLRTRFGNVFASIAPDFNFCFRCLDNEDSILFLDKSPMFHYALNRSNGASVSRGEMTPDNADFTANLPVDNSIRNYATPIPQLNTAVNAVFNEYLLYKQESASPRFFDIDFQKYLELNAVEMTEVSDPQLKAEMYDLLEKHGYGASTRPETAAPPPDHNWLKRVRSFIGRLKTPPASPGLEFAELEDAIEYVRNSSHSTPQSSSAVRELLHARELPLQ